MAVPATTPLFPALARPAGRTGQLPSALLSPASSEIRLGEMAETLGYDSVWSVEHHFDDYSMCPDATQALSYLAGRTSSITLGTGAVILPWNDPLRVAEKITMLDHLAEGRLVFGMGRGLARMEYAGFRQDMNEARERSDEGADDHLGPRNRGDGERWAVLPAARAWSCGRVRSRSFKERTYSVAMSPDSVDAAAELGVGMMTFLQYAIADHLPGVDRYRELFRAAHGTEPKPPTSRHQRCVQLRRPAVRQGGGELYPVLQGGAARAARAPTLTTADGSQRDEGDARNVSLPTSENGITQQRSGEVGRWLHGSLLRLRSDLDVWWCSRDAFRDVKSDVQTGRAAVGAAPANSRDLAPVRRVPCRRSRDARRTGEHPRLPHRH